MTEHDFNEMSNNVKQVLEILEGRGLHKNNGVIDRQCRIEKRVSGHDRILWMMGGAYVLILLIISIISSMS